jgi:urease accessory protein
LTAVTTHGASLTFVSFLVMGGLLATDARLSTTAITALATLIGLFHGYLDGSGMGRPEDGVFALLGLVFTVFVLVALAASFVVPLRQQWARIAVRVAGSWIAAIGLLMFGWAERRG